MPPLVLVLVLGSAVMHATWNAMLRSGQDRLWSISLMCLVAAAVSAPFLFILPAPAPASWPYAVGSAGLQIGYCLFLIRAYRDGQLGQVYPIARGSAPMLVALGAAVFAGEQLSPQALSGLALVCVGIMGLSLGRDRADIRSIAAAVVTGVFIAGYMVTDGVGVRLSGRPTSYVVWMTFIQGAPMPLVYLAIRRCFPPIRADRETFKALGGGLIGLVSYGVVVWAMSATDMAKVSGLRETSILFAAILGAIFLKERFTIRRAVCAIVISGGAILLAG
ncbi:EamA family transporter [Phenylobacterium sp.]|uniref:EamA family transporter n=1 Tax=Phenylobacterium sp. TaxID=1871053 RepID=UPI003562CB76